MAIKINAGAAPRLGRITMPQGTYLSDQAPFSQPTTAASGGLGTGGSGLPPLPPNPFVQPPPQQNPLQPVQNAFTQVYDALKSIDQQYKEAYAEQERNAPTREEIRSKYGENVAGYYDFWLRLTGRNTATTNAFNKNAPSNDLVGSNIASVPAGLPGHQVKQIFPGLTDAQIVQEMQAKGYTRSYQPGVGDWWTKTGEGTPTQGGTQGGAQGGSIDARGRPEFVDPTLLARGERVTTQSGTTFVGGTPTASGQAQYAVTYAGGVSDERYKWAERTTQDRDGNWVKVYSRELRKTYTRGHRKRKQQRAEEEAQAQQVQELPQPSVTVSPPVGYSQLVNLRADFG